MVGFKRNMETKRGRKFWETVDDNADNSPQWLKDRIINAPLNINKPNGYNFRIIIKNCEGE